MLVERGSLVKLKKALEIMIIYISVGFGEKQKRPIKWVCKSSDKI
jgi:hypothetical protein